MFCCSPIFSQNSVSLPQIVPPSPEAFNFSNYGNIPQNGSTGGFSYSIPLFNIREGDINVATSLDYFGNGVNVDALSPVTGMGWTLNAGGVISRIVRDEPDETVQERWYPESIDTNSEYNKIKDAANSENTDLDTEPDWFSFNVNGISGNFYFDENLNININSDKYLKITRNPNTNNFVLTDENGFKYIFGGSSEYLESNLSSTSCASDSRQSMVTAWYLSKIISPQNNHLDFHYQDNSMHYATSLSNTLNLLERCKSSGGQVVPYDVSHNKCISYSFLDSRVISEISSSNGKIKFQYAGNRSDVISSNGLYLDKVIKVGRDVDLEYIDFSYDSTYSESHKDPILANEESLRYRYYLSKIIRSNKNHVDPQTFSFEYNNKDELPCRLSYNRDIFGFFNNSNNSVPFPDPRDSQAYAVAKKNASSFIGANQDVNPSTVDYGLLTKINYPTGGFTSIEYEANSDIGYVQSEVFDKHSIHVDKPCGTGTSVFTSDPFTFISNGSPILYSANATSALVCENSQPDEIHDRYVVSIRNLTEDRSVRSFTRSQGEYVETDPSYKCNNATYHIQNPLCTDEGKVYEVIFTVSSLDNQISGGINLTYNRRFESVEKVIYGGGARVKRIVDHDADKIDNDHFFYYNPVSDKGSANTSLTKIFDPQFSQFYNYTRVCSDEDFKYLTESNSYYFSSGTLNSLYSNRKQGVYYDVISQESLSNDIDNGFTEKYFHNIYDPAPNYLREPKIFGVPRSNSSDLYYGQLDSINYYKTVENQLVKIKKEVNNYDVKLSDYNTSTVFRKNFDFGNLPVYDDDISNISIAQYRNYIFKKRLSSSIVHEYFPDTITTKKTFEYGLEPYFSLITENMRSSNDKKIYSYAYDYPQYLSSLTVAEEKLLINNQIATPVKTTSFLKNEGVKKELKSTKTDYAIWGSLVLPSSIETLKDSYVLGQNEFESRIIYHSYDSYGNPLEVSKAEGPHTCYIWGYNGQYPVAKIENAEASDVASALGGGSLSDYGEDNLDDIDGLRGDPVFNNAMITTYTYEPLVGVTSITDPRGQTTTYEYDGFGRLEAVRDAEGKLLSENKYHYAGQGQ